MEKRYLIGQNPGEVEAAMREEQCGHCIGCPFATLAAAALVHRTNMVVDFTFETNGFESGLIDEVNQEINDYRAKLRAKTKNCSGYSEVKRPSGRPAKMCDSPEVHYPKISLWAGRLLEILDPNNTANP